MRHKGIEAVAALTAIAALLLGACSDDRNNAAITSSPATVTTTKNPAQESGEAAAWQSQDAVERKQADSKISAIEAQVKAADSLDTRLSIIVTEYCRIQGMDRMPVDDDESRGLKILYNKYWQAGGRWSDPLDTAAQQQGACPTPLPMTHAGPVG